MTSRAYPYLLTAALIAIMVAWLLAAGRAPICACGVIRLWGENNTAEGSQQLFDWYTPSHVLHGFLFYALLWLVARRLPIGWRLAIATAVECLWEAVENSPMIIERYRTATIALGYDGDSVLNSFMDVMAMLAGFWMARKLPVWASVAVVIGAEAFVMWVIRDGLALNILMLLWPVDAVRVWQQGGL